MRRYALAFALVFTASVAHAQLLAPSHYLAFSNPGAGAAVSPFAGMSFGYFHLETFEDGLLNAPGVQASIAGNVLAPGTFTDSVDADDGFIDGSGAAGRSYFRGGDAISGARVAFTFNAAQLGGLPTHVGIVWTDGSGVITFSAYDADGISLGSSIGPSPGIAGSHTGQTAEDTFFGIIHAGGISRIDIHVGTPGTATGIEVDHLQYGLVPEPSSLLLLLAGLGLLGCNRWTDFRNSKSRNKARSRRHRETTT